jgi:SAM-dependent methyltransferase
MEPDFYSRYYAAVRQSRIHSEFCRHVFGIDLSQHGFADTKQLELAMRTSRLDSGSNALDVGCGTGMITEYLSDCTRARFTGLDNSVLAIEQAMDRTGPKSDRLRFLVQDINDLRLPSRSFHLVLLVDSIYFSGDYDATISRLRDSLAPGGIVIAFYSVGPALLGTWDFPGHMVEAETTPLAEALRRNGLVALHHDLTTLDYELAEKRKAFLEAHEREFRDEKMGFIYENRLGDSTDIMKAIDHGRHRRYMYHARVS